MVALRASDARAFLNIEKWSTVCTSLALAVLVAESEHPSRPI